MPQLQSSHRSHLSISGSPDDLKALRAAHTVRDPGDLLVRVYLLRQVTATINGMKAWRNKVIGEGTIWHVGEPQSLDKHSEHHAALDWAGELRVEQTVSVPSFAVEDLSVKDCVAEHLPASYAIFALLFPSILHKMSVHRRDLSSSAPC